MNADEVRPGLGMTNLSLPAQMQRALSKREKLNLCPYGCVDEDLNEHGYCRHLVGWTNHFHADGSPKVGEVVELREYEVVTNPKAVAKKGADPILVAERVGIDKGKLRADDVLVVITTSARVYRSFGDARVIKTAPQSDVGVLQTQVAELQQKLAQLTQAKPEAPKVRRTRKKKEEEPIPAAG